MGFGFVISRFGLLVHELTNQGGVTPPPNGSSASVMGVALVGAGIVVNVWSSVRHVHMLRRLRSGERDVVNPRGPVAIGVACGVGGLVLIALLLSTLAR